MKLISLSVYAYLFWSFLLLLISRVKNEILISTNFLISTVFSIIGLFGLYRIINGDFKIDSIMFLINNFIFNSNNIDNLSSFFLLIIFLVMIPVSIYSYYYIKNLTKSVRFFLFNFNLLFISMIGVVLSCSFINFMLFWELMAISSFFLVVHNNDKEDVRKASLIYFIANNIGAIFLVAGFSLITQDNLNFLSSIINKNSLAFIFFLIGFGLKAGFVPFHIWLPFAHPQAPSNISAVMSGIMIKMGIYGIFRVLKIIQPLQDWWGWLILIIGIISAFLGVIFAIVQHDIKKLLAYHSIENIGIILIGLGLYIILSYRSLYPQAYIALCGSLFHTFNHAVFKSLLFLSAGSVIKNTNISEIDKLGGLIKKIPHTSYSFLIGSIAISGIPPLNGFISEFFIYYSSFYSLRYSYLPSSLTIISLSAIGALAALCFAKVFGVVFLGYPRVDKNYDLKIKESKSLVIPLYMLSAVCIILGFFTPFILNLLIEHNIFNINLLYLENILNSLYYISFSYLILILIFVIFWSFRKYLYNDKIISKSSTWDCGYAFPNNRMQYTASSFVQPVADFFNKILMLKNKYPEISEFFQSSNLNFSTHPIPVFYNKIYKPITLKVKEISKKYMIIQSGNIQIYVLYILLGLIFLIIWKI